MVQLSTLSEADRLSRMQPAKHVASMVLDTDTYNEIDDQFALVWSMISPEAVNVEAIYAAPFHNEKSVGPEDGMHKSYDEIVRLLVRLGKPTEDFVYRGSTRWLGATLMPVESPAAHDLVRRAMQPRDTPLYVVAIGAITNVASALLIEPKIADRIVVAWLGGHPSAWHDTNEFNLYQDVYAAQVIFDSGVPLVHFPCRNVAEHLRTTLPEITQHVKGRGAIGDYLHEVYLGCASDHLGYSRIIWDLAPVAWLINAAWIDTVRVSSPRPTPQLTWDRDPHRHLIMEAIGLNRDAIFRDFFLKLPVTPHLK